MNREQYLSERSAIVDDYIASGQLRRYERDIDRLNAAYEAAGGFADEAAASVGVPNTVSGGDPCAGCDRAVPLSACEDCNVESCAACWDTWGCVECGDRP